MSLRSVVAGVPFARLAAWVAIARLGLAPLVASVPDGAWPPLSDLSTKLRSELPSLPSPDASHTNSAAYARSLAPWVLSADEPAASPPVLKTNLYPGGSAYLRVGTVAPPLLDALRSAVAGLQKNGPLFGLVLDLRFADGADLGSGIAAASAFASNGPVEFKLGETAWRTQREGGAPAFPILILVNRQTRQAAEAFASAVRAVASKSMVLGSPTAGQARAYRTVVVSESLSLRIAAEPLRLPDGSEFPASGLQPDLVVKVSEADERAYAVDEFRRVIQGRAMAPSGSGRMNEAELVRRRRGPRTAFEDLEGEADSGRRGAGRLGHSDVGATSAEEPPRAVQDPALAVALDLISGFAADAPEPTKPVTSSGDSR